MSGGDSPISHPANKLYIGNLDYKVTSEVCLTSDKYIFGPSLQELSSHFKSAHGFVSAEVASSSNGRSRGYGLVEFSSAAAANNAVEKFNETEIGDRKIFVRLDRGANAAGEGKREMRPRGPNASRPGPHRSNIAPLKVRPEDDGRLLYVGNIPWRSSWQDIKDHFRDVGSVIRVDIPLDKETRRSRGFATVLYERKEDAAAAIEKLNNTELNGRPITVRYDQYVGGKREQKDRDKS